MKVFIDLHIHSALSPCGDISMTPNNIINMAYIKGLDIISVTDHNSMMNVRPIMKLGHEKGILVIPGTEVTTKEEVHVLCYFKGLDEGMEFNKVIYDSLPGINNKKELFGEQYIMDYNDEIIGEEKKLLINSSSYTLEQISSIVNEYKGVMVPAHVFRKSNGILSNLGFIPNNLDIRTIELSYKDQRYEKNPNNMINKFQIIRNSDAHYLENISEPIFKIELKELSTHGFLEYLRGE